MSNKIKVWNTNSSAKPNNAIKVFEYGSTATKPNDAILVTSADNGPANAIKVNVVNDYAVDAIPVWYAAGSEPSPTPTWETVTIGNRIWMAENLQYDDGLSGIFRVDNFTVNGVNLGTQYFYHEEVARRINETSAFPGWHVPTIEDFEDLQNAVNENSESLRTTTAWSDDMNGTNTLGFNGEPIGCGSMDEDTGEIPEDGLWGQGDEFAFWLHDNEGDSDSYDVMGELYKENYISYSWDWMNYLCQIRLVKDNL